ncbi:gypsy type transposase [Tanacetum coccineum]
MSKLNASLATVTLLFLVSSYVTSTTAIPGGRTKVEDVTSNKEVQAVGKYSVEEYNRLKGNKDNDGQLMFVKLVNKTSGEVEVFEAVVVVKPWLRKKELVKFAPSQKTMSILQPVWRTPTVDRVSRSCFLCLVGLSPYYPFDENSYLAFEYPNGLGGCYFLLVVALLHYEASSVNVYFAEMGLFDFIKTADPRKVQAVEVQKGDDQVTLLESTRHCFMPLVIPAAGGDSSAAAAEVSAPTKEGQEGVALEEAYLELADPDEGTTAVRQSEEEVVTEQPKKVKKKRLLKQSDVLPAKKLRVDHPTLVSGTDDKTLAGLEQIRLADSRLPDQEQLVFHSVAPSSKEREDFLDSSAQTNLRIHTTVESTLGILVDTIAAAITSTRAVVTNFATDVNPDLAGPSQPEGSEGSDDSFYEPPTLDPSEAKRWLLEEKDLEILRLKFQLAEKEAEAAKVIRLRDQVSSLSGEKSALTAEVSVLKMTVTQKDHDISLLDSRAACLVSTLDDAKVSSLHAGFQDFKEKMEIQQKEQAQELFNRVAELEAHVMDVSGRLEGEFYPGYLTTLAGKRWLLTHGIQFVFLKCFKSPEYQGTLGHALGRAVDFDMREGLEAGLLKDETSLGEFVESKKDAEMDEVLDVTYWTVLLWLRMLRTAA